MSIEEEKSSVFSADSVCIKSSRFNAGCNRTRAYKIQIFQSMSNVKGVNEMKSR